MLQGLQKETQPRSSFVLRINQNQLGIFLFYFIPFPLQTASQWGRAVHSLIQLLFPLCMIPWAAVKLSREQRVTVGSKSWALLELVRDKAALQPGAASPEPKPEQAGLISKTCCLPKFQARILGKTFWDLYKYFSGGGEPSVLALALLQAVEKFKRKYLFSDTGNPPVKGEPSGFVV